MSLVKRWMDELEERGFGEITDVLCTAHIVDDYLQGILVTELTAGHCFVCGQYADNQAPAEAILYRMMPILRRDLEPAHDPFAAFETSDILSNYFDDVFAGDVSDEIMERFSSVVTSTDWNDRNWLGPYGESDHFSPAAGWGQFSDLVQHTSRFIFLKGSDTRLPDGGPSAAYFVEDFKQMIRQHSNRLVRRLDLGEPLYRGRLIGRLSQAQRLAKAQELGAAPSEHAGANRMSPAGIPMFYASGDPETAVAEIAAHDAQQRELAIVGAFRATRRLVVLDVHPDNLDLPSAFDQSRAEERNHFGFLRAFASDITRPIRLDGREHREYAPTQVLTELVRWLPNPHIDGIRMRSAQTGRPTYVLFFGRDDATDHASPDHDDVPLTLKVEDIDVYRIRRRVESEPALRALWTPE
ncbi:RES family NAD+ phosphorylase [Promicromonospora sp. NPDC019610]|uniref:RES family NAD+ phosphorylase n=1 Tax=Promicromonospora sp. NPDC019610 TaxID=3364405 RepID=UPI003796650E